jgi:hypothetical protein
MAIDTSKPHLGRIYDFILGGHHNYEVDRLAAARILEKAPTYPKWARANRWFLQFVASQWLQEGRKQVLDLASGLPTKGHYNDTMPDARILFTDNDALSVAYGVDMLADKTNMVYRLADLGDPATLIAEAQEFFADDRAIAISCIGVAYLVPDAVLAKVLSMLHAWSAPGSVLALTVGVSPDGDGDRAALEAALEAFRKHANAPMYVRTTEELAALASPWRLKISRSLPDWLGAPDMFTAEELAATGGGGMAGAFFER